MTGSISVKTLLNEGKVEYFPIVLTFLYGVKEFLEMNFEETLQKELLGWTANKFISQWLGRVVIHLQPYLELISADQNQSNYLDQRLLSNFPERVLLRLNALQTRLKVVNEEPHKALFMMLEPAFGRYSEELQKRCSNPQSFILALNDPRRPSILGLLSERLNSEEGKIIQEAINQITSVKTYSLYRESFQDFVSEQKLLCESNLFQIETIKLMMSLSLDKKWTLEQTLRLSQKSAIRLYEELREGLTKFLKQFKEIMLDGISLSTPELLPWHLVMDSISQEKETVEEFCLEGVKGKRYLKPEIVKQLFEGSEFSANNTYGRHKVKAIRCRVGDHLDIGLHIKKNPELFGRELMVHHLARQLSDNLITPPIALLCLSRWEGLHDKVMVYYPFLVSLTIEGDTLKDALDHRAYQLKNLDKRSFSEALGLALLINPEDGREDNYILKQKIQDKAIQFRSIDNDHTFVRPLATDEDGQEIEGPLGMQVKTILYCFDQMQEPLDSQFCERLLSLDPYTVIKKWLDDLGEEQKRIENLTKDKKGRIELKRRGIYLDIEFKLHIVIDIYEKLVRMQESLRKDPKCTGMRLLRKTIPNLSVRCLEVFDKFNTPEERFHELTKGCFGQGKMKALEFQLYQWPRSRIDLLNCPGIDGDAIVLTQDKDSVVEAYYIRNGQWVTRGTFFELRKVVLAAGISLDFTRDTNGKVIINAKNRKEVEALFEQAKKKIMQTRGNNISQTKASDIILMTGDKISEEIKREKEVKSSPKAVLAQLQEEFSKQSNLRNIQTELQQGNVQRFLALPLTEHRELIINGSKQWSGLDFGLMKNPSGEPDGRTQIAVLEAISKLSFRVLHLRNCEALTDENLNKILRKSRGLLALKLESCPKLTDAVFGVIRKNCIALEKLSLVKLNITKVYETFYRLRALEIKDCTRFEVWKGEVLSLNRLKVQNCPVTLMNTQFYERFPFLFSLSVYDAQVLNNFGRLRGVINLYEWLVLDRVKR